MILFFILCGLFSSWLTYTAFVGGSVICQVIWWILVLYGTALNLLGVGEKTENKGAALIALCVMFVFVCINIHFLWIGSSVVAFAAYCLAVVLGAISTFSQF